MRGGERMPSVIGCVTLCTKALAVSRSLAFVPSEQTSTQSKGRQFLSTIMKIVLLHRPFEGNLQGAVAHDEAPVLGEDVGGESKVYT